MSGSNDSVTDNKIVENSNNNGTNEKNSIPTLFKIFIPLALACFSGGYFVGFIQGEQKNKVEIYKERTEVTTLKNKNERLDKKINELKDTSYEHFFMSNLRYLNDPSDEPKKNDFVKKIIEMESKGADLPKGNSYCVSGTITLPKRGEWPIPSEIKWEIHKKFSSKCKNKK